MKSNSNFKIDAKIEPVCVNIALIAFGNVWHDYIVSKNRRIIITAIYVA